MDGYRTSIEPNHGPHEKLKEDFEQYAKDHDFIIMDTGYESMYSDETLMALKNNYSPMGLEIRTYPDCRVTYIYSTMLSFLVEFKTDTGNYTNLSLELVPFLYNKKFISKRKSDCLYSIRIKNQDYGFWSSNPPQISRIMIPPKYKNARWIKELCHDYYPDITIEIKESKGSNDPFLIIKERILKTLPTWQQIITEKINNLQISNKLEFKNNEFSDSIIQNNEMDKKQISIEEMRIKIFNGNGHKRKKSTNRINPRQKSLWGNN